MKEIHSTRRCLWLGLLSSLLSQSNGFTNPSCLTKACQHVTPPQLPLQKQHIQQHKLQMAYVPPEDAEHAKLAPKKLPTPKIGDVVRYYDIDGGRLDGQVLVGKISLIQPIASSTPNGQEPTNDDGTNKWLVEISEMEDVGDGYYAEYPSRKRRRSALRKLEDIAPLAASFVRTEDAYKIPMERGTNRPMAFATYDLLNYEGPLSVPINNDVVQADGEVYKSVKMALLKNTALAGLAGTVVADLVRGTEDAVIYFAGATAGLLYLFFLGIKTDTLGSVDAKLGSNVSNLRFVFPALVLIGVALYNFMVGNPELQGGLFSTVTPEQFGAAIIGFLTYRGPLFISQLFPVLFDSASDMLPGSAGIAVRMAAEAKKRGVDVSELDNKQRDDGLVTVLLVSGPEGTGKTTLVNKLIESDNRFMRPIVLDRVVDGIKFERMEQRGEFLTVDKSGRYGLSKDGVLQAAALAKGDSDAQKVVVVDADVSLARKLSTLSGARIVGVWVGLDSLEKFESRLGAKIQSDMSIPDGETEDSLLRAKVKQAISDIEYGVLSGVFEFTILNEDLDESVKELKDAAEYCFK